jgi:hypothetical protein
MINTSSLDRVKHNSLISGLSYNHYTTAPITQALKAIEAYQVSSITTPLPLVKSDPFIARNNHLSQLNITLNSAERISSNSVYFNCTVDVHQQPLRYPSLPHTHSNQVDVVHEIYRGEPNRLMDFLHKGGNFRPLGVGHEVMAFIKHLHTQVFQRDIATYPSEMAKEFYKKEGFMPEPAGVHQIWYHRQ